MNDLLDAVRQAYALAPAAILAGLLCALACAALGTLLRWRRLVWTGFAVPQVATLGVAFALGRETLSVTFPFLGLLPDSLAGVGLWSTLATAVAVLCLVPFGREHRGEGGAAIAFLASTAGAVLLVAQDPHGTEEIRMLATGHSLLFATPQDVGLLAVVLLPVAALAVVTGPAVAAVAFDRAHAKASGVRTWLVDGIVAAQAFAVLASVAPRAGAPFAFAFLTVPAAAAERLSASPTAWMALSAGIGLLGFGSGAVAAVAWDLPFGPPCAAGVLAVGGALVLGARVAEWLRRSRP